MEQFEPRQFGKYFLLEKLAVGGMAEIYEAKTYGVDGFEKLLAIKRILPHCSADKEFITMLIDEAKLSVLLSHANIVQVYDLGKVDDDYFIAMEFINGVNLRDVIYRCREKKISVPPDVSVYIASEICKGLDYAHRKADTSSQPLGIVHRDVSPQNVLISYEGEVKLVDFGIAKAAMNISHTMAGILKGKIAYMSPEQALGKSIDRRTDIFSAGILLYEMLTGAKLFTGESQFEVLKKIRTTRIDTGSLPELIPQQLRPILAKALAYKPDDRFQNAGDFQVELTKFLYAIYLDFSPRKLSKFISDMFKEEVKQKAKREGKLTNQDQLTSSMSVKEKKKQVEIVHRDVTPSPKETTSKGSVKAPDVVSFWKKPWAVGVGATAFFATAFLATSIFFPGLRFWDEKVPELPVAEQPTRETPIAEVPTTKPAPETLQKRGVLNVISSPPGAIILIDRRVTGLSTPATIENLPIQKEFRVTISKPNYHDYNGIMTLASAEPQTLSTTLKSFGGEPTPPPQQPEPEQPKPTPSLGSLNVTSTPSGAAVFIGKKRYGTTPLTISELEIGKTYTMRFEKEGYKTTSQKKTIASESEPLAARMTEETARPEPEPVAGGEPGKIKMASIPEGADVFINSEYRGTTPLTVSVPSGSVSLVVNKEGKARYTRRVEVKPGETVDLKTIALQELYGEVSIVTTPPRAVVTFDGQRIPAKTPVTIRRVRTDQQHSLSVSLQGHREWSKSFRMEENEKSFNILLEKE